MLGRCVGGCPNDELLRAFSSKLPADRFSFSVAASAKPESFRDIGVVGICGKLTDIGDTELGGLVLLDLLVAGRSGATGLV